LVERCCQVLPWQRPCMALAAAQLQHLVIAQAQSEGLPLHWMAGTAAHAALCAPARMQPPPAANDVPCSMELPQKPTAAVQHRVWQFYAMPE
jgi:hypothetical protein